MNIANIFNQINTAINGYDSSVTSASNEGAVTVLKGMEASLQNGLDALMSMTGGSTISGEVVSAEGNNVILKLSENQLVNAQIEGNISPSVGENLSFTVNKQGDGKVSLSPLFINTAADDNASVALKSANLPDTPKNQYVVTSMMEEGLPVDKNSLYAMNKAVAQFPDTDPKILASMTRLEIPLTSENIETYENYSNYEHQLTNSISDITESFAETFAEILNEKDGAEALLFSKDVLSVLVDENGLVEGSLTEEGLTEEGIIEEGIIEEGISEGENAGNANIKNELADLLKNLGADESTVSSFKENPVSDKAFLKEVLNLISENTENTEEISKEALKDTANALKELFNNDAFKEILKDNISSKYLLKPEEVGKEDSVKNLYDKLDSDTKTLLNVLNAHDKVNTPLGQNVSNISNNLDFMNELNNAFNYVQIPLKLTGQEATGDLYVYTNKRSLAQRDGDISALLHLDMENLGPLDVHVTLSMDNNVKTRFMVADDEALDLIADNIDILNERLNSRGYNMKAEFVNKNEDKTVFKTMVESGKTPYLSHNSFDMRA